MVRRDRMALRERIITEIGYPEGEDNVWKAIDRLAPKRKRNVAATLKKENGQWCYDEEEELQEVKKMQEKSSSKVNWGTQDPTGHPYQFSSLSLRPLSLGPPPRKLEGPLARPSQAK